MCINLVNKNYKLLSLLLFMSQLFSGVSTGLTYMLFQLCITVGDKKVNPFNVG